MPLVELFFRPEDAPDFRAQELCTFMEGLFGVQPGIVQVMMVPAWDLAPEQAFMSIRAKGTPERKEKVNELLAAMGVWLTSHGILTGRTRIELFEPTQQAAQRWGPPIEELVVAPRQPSCWCGVLKFFRRGGAHAVLPEADPELPMEAKPVLVRGGFALPEQAPSNGGAQAVLPAPRPLSPRVARVALLRDVSTLPAQAPKHGPLSPTKPAVLRGGSPLPVQAQSKVLGA
mmetsp:Transcript_46742/g.99867  ORF Transcript_46742/g.99867 Transcript_46742/m.99867 type:complete len:230 (-) Transcript_46742:144-833(-)|eukprot:CAMPEP_0180536732 /NCGR_PEP_ID=MMETSP1036_2-20121128/65438_1 /TAXON_ID=632150 /ORGANISM="Azadinium spinosum, Strain 3D9" /LENGTH=229 /DNA_ID=CAMNT_0022551277 /DNA_START=72 /DNA_END=761 /DNA_ORIENTATION=-